MNRLQMRLILNNRASSEVQLIGWLSALNTWVSLEKDCSFGTCVCGGRDRMVDMHRPLTLFILIKQNEDCGYILVAHPVYL